MTSPRPIPSIQTSGPGSASPRCTAGSLPASSDLLSMALPAGEQVEQLRGKANDQVITLIERAKAAGRLREDLVGEDLLLLLIANAAVVHVTCPDAPGAWRRFVALAIDAFQRHDAPPLPAPLSAAQMTRAMLRLARERGCGKAHMTADPAR